MRYLTKQIFTSNYRFFVTLCHKLSITYLPYQRYVIIEWTLNKNFKFDLVELALLFTKKAPLSSEALPKSFCLNRTFVFYFVLIIVWLKAKISFGSEQWATYRLLGNLSITMRESSSSFLYFGLSEGSPKYWKTHFYPYQLRRYLITTMPFRLFPD